MSAQTSVAFQKGRYNARLPADTVSCAMVLFAVRSFLLLSRLLLSRSSTAPRAKAVA